MKKKLVRQITDNALIAALYYVLTIILSGFAFQDVQFRIAEIFLFLMFFRKDFIIGVTLGTFLVNLHSTLLPWDPLFGTLATLISGLLISLTNKKIFGVIIPTVINGLVVGAMLNIILDMPFFASAGLVALGEFAVLTIGYFIFKILEKNETFLNIISTGEVNKHE